MNSKEKEFEKIYNSYKKELFSYIYYISGSRDIAEDILQETFLRFWKRMQYIDFLNLKAYLFKTARNIFIDIKRKEKRIKLVPLEEEFIDKEVEDLGYRIIKKERIKKILERLDEEEREIILLRFWEDMKIKEIAKILGIKEVTCRVRLFRILKKIKDMI